MNPGSNLDLNSSDQDPSFVPSRRDLHPPLIPGCGRKEKNAAHLEASIRSHSRVVEVGHTVTSALSLIPHDWQWSEGGGALVSASLTFDIGRDCHRVWSNSSRHSKNVAAKHLTHVPRLG